MIQKRISLSDARILILGLTFKENCPDLRNTRVVDIMLVLKSYGCTVDVYDPWVSSEEAEAEYGIRPIPEPSAGKYDGILIAVGHGQFREMGATKVRGFGKPGAVQHLWEGHGRPWCGKGFGGSDGLAGRMVCAHS
jgi:UDP-N-acetyl-D-galactosamine dehydrogenase